MVLGEDEETRRVLVGMVRRELETLHGEMKVQPVEDLALTGDAERWVNVEALRQQEADAPRLKKHKMAVKPSGRANVNAPTELDKLLPATARAA